jgi:hypothetical protein
MNRILLVTFLNFIALQARADVSAFTHKLIDAGLRSTAVSFSTEIKLGCIDHQGSVDVNAAKRSAEGSNEGKKIEMKGKIAYDSNASTCTGTFTVTDIKSGTSRDFSLPLTAADKLAR